MNETKKRKELSTFLWILITLTLIVLVPLTFFILYQISLTRSIATEERRNHLHTISHYLARELDGYISDSMEEVATLAGISEVQTYLANKERVPQEPEMLEFLEKFRRIGGYNAAYLMDNNGKCVASTSPNFVGKDYSFRPYFKNAIAGRRYFYMAVGVTSDIPGFYFSAPVYHDGHIAGVAVGKALISEASDNFSDEHVSKSMNVFLVTEDGVVIAGSNPAFMLKSLAPLSAETNEKLQKSRQFSNRDIPSLNYRALWDHIRTGKHDESTTHTDTAVSSERLTVFAPLSEQNWHVVVSEDAAVVQAYVNSQIKNLLFVGLGVWVLICVSSYGASRILARTIGNMSKTISMIGSGRHDLRLKPGGPRELKEMCREFNSMADKLAASHESLERQIAERTEQLRRKKELSENIIETAKSLVVVLDRNAAVVTFNRFAEELTGYSRKEVLGKNWLEMFIPQRDRERIRQVFQNCLDGDLPENVENTIICKRGEERTILWNNSVLRDGRGNITGTLSLGSDITERKRAEKEIRQAREKAETISRELAEKVNELERFNRLAVGREMKMIELKRQVNNLCSELGKEPVHVLSFDETESGSTLE